MTISSARERTNNQDDMFEKDCSEAIGFQDGFKPYKDLQNNGMLALLSSINFIERTNSIYDECLSQEEIDQGMTGENIFMQNLSFISQNSPKTVKNDGFPLILVLIDVVNNCMNLIQETPFKPKNIEHKNVLNYWKHQQKVFKLIAQKYFRNNVYDTFNEYVYHMVMNFTFAWKYSLEKMNSQFTWNMDMFEKRQNGENNLSTTMKSMPAKQIVYLYRSIISKQIMDDEMKESDLKNEYSIDEYTETMDAVEDFVYSNI